MLDDNVPAPIVWVDRALLGLKRTILRLVECEASIPARTFVILHFVVGDSSSKSATVALCNRDRCQLSARAILNSL